MRFPDRILGKQTLHDPDSDNLPDYCTAFYTGTSQYRLVHSVPCDSLADTNRAIHLLSPSDHVDGYAKIQQEAHSFWSMELGSIWTADKFMFYGVLAIDHDFHDFPSISTGGCGKHELWKLGSWYSVHYQCKFMAYEWKKDVFWACSRSD